MLLPVMLLLSAAPTFEWINQPTHGPITGDPVVWYEAGETAGGIPLGGLGTGFLELNSDGRFGTTTIENDWLKPRPVTPGSGFIVDVAGKTVLDLTDAAAKIQCKMRGHWPAADIEFDPIPLNETDTVTVKLHAFSPVVPHKYEVSGLPIVFFRVEVRHSGPKEGPDIGGAGVKFRWKPKEPVENPQPVAVEDDVPELTGVMLPVPGGSYAVGAPGRPFNTRAWTASDGALEADCSDGLKRNQAVSFTFALAWHFPEWTSSDGETLRHRYAKRFKDAGEVLIFGMARSRDLDWAVNNWQRHVYTDEVPISVMDASVNGLYVLAKNSWWLDDGRFFQSESFTGCPITETFVCRFYGSFPLAILWPELEKATLREFVKHQAENGQIPFGFGAPMGTKTPMMNLQVPIVSTEFALNVWRDYKIWQDYWRFSGDDDGFLKEVYPAAKKALQFAMTLDTDGDGLVNEAPGNEEGFPANQYYDIWPWWGTSAYVGGISLAAWRAGEEMAKVIEDAEFEKQMRDMYERGARAYDEKLWTGSYYRLYSGDAKHPASDTSLTNALCGQWYAFASGLGYILPREKVASTIDTVFRLNVAATPYGAVNGVKPDGTPDTSFKDHSAVMTIGEVWCFADMAVREGHRREDAIRLFETSYENIALKQKTPWNIPWSLDPDTGAIKWGINYYSNPCVWSLYMGLGGVAAGLGAGYPYEDWWR